jgi:hypothetical protein
VLAIHSAGRERSMPLRVRAPLTAPPGADVVTSPLNFTSTLVAVTATSAGTATAVWGDFTPNFGGLGLDTGTGDDQIEGGGILRLHFASAVTLTGVATLFDPAHAPFGSGNPLTGNFLFCAGNSACTPLPPKSPFLKRTVPTARWVYLPLALTSLLRNFWPLMEMLNSMYLH